jgi:SAM-dependent methyltransferase
MSGVHLRDQRAYTAPMAENRHDAWAAGDAYDQYMGRWSRTIAPLFLDWLDAPKAARWLDVGCGTGALSAAILQGCAPHSVQGVDPSEGFVAQARANVPDARAQFMTGDAQDLPVADASADVTVSALMLNFVPDKPRAIAELRRVTRPGGVVGFYVWDYPGGGVEFMRAFWDAAVALDPAARELTEAARFPFCTEQGLRDLAARGGLAVSAFAPLEAPSVFKDFEDYWRPFTLGAGPAPGDCASHAPEARERLRQRLHDTLPRQADGAIALKLRAWALKAPVR